MNIKLIYFYNSTNHCIIDTDEKQVIYNIMDNYDINLSKTKSMSLIGKILKIDDNKTCHIVYEN